MLRSLMDERTCVQEEGGGAYELLGINPWNGDVLRRAELSNEQKVKIVQLGYA